MCYSSWYHYSVNSKNIHYALNESWVPFLLVNSHRHEMRLTSPVELYQQQLLHTKESSNKSFCVKATSLIIWNQNLKIILSCNHRLHTQKGVGKDKGAEKGFSGFMLNYAHAFHEISIICQIKGASKPKNLSKYSV